MANIEKSRPVSNRSMAVRLSALEFFGKISENMSAYTVLFLQNLGYRATQVSLVQSCLSLVGIFAPTFWGIVSDKRRTIKWILVICFIISACRYPFIPRAAGIMLTVFQWELPVPFGLKDQIVLDAELAKKAVLDTVLRDV